MPALLKLVLILGALITFSALIGLLAQQLRDDIGREMLDALQKWGIFYSTVLFTGTLFVMGMAECIFQGLVLQALFVVAVAALVIDNPQRIHRFVVWIFKTQIPLEPHFFMGLLLLTSCTIFSALGVNLEPLESLTLVAEHEWLTVIAGLAVFTVVVRIIGVFKPLRPRL